MDVIANIVMDDENCSQDMRNRALVLDQELDERNIQGILNSNIAAVMRTYTRPPVCDVSRHATLDKGFIHIAYEYEYTIREIDRVAICIALDRKLSKLKFTYNILTKNGYSKGACDFYVGDSVNRTSIVDFLSSMCLEIAKKRKSLLSDNTLDT